MRNATILMVNLKGVATEAIKNIVLAGIGKLIVVDPEDIAPEDLGAGFFYRDEDVGRKVSDTGGPGGCLLVQRDAPHTRGTTSRVGSCARLRLVRLPRVAALPATRTQTAGRPRIPCQVQNGATDGALIRYQKRNGLCERY